MVFVPSLFNSNLYALSNQMLQISVINELLSYEYYLEFMHLFACSWLLS